MSDVQSDVSESQAVQAALTAAQDAVDATKPVTSEPSTDEKKTEPVVDHAIAAAGVKTEPVAKATLGASQAGNAMDTMHGKVNKTWPPSTR